MLRMEVNRIGLKLEFITIADLLMLRFLKPHELIYGSIYISML